MTREFKSFGAWQRPIRLSQVHTHRFDLSEKLVRMQAPAELPQSSAICDAGCIKKLLAEGAAPSGVDFTGATPLHMAGVSGQPKAAEMLLKAGARPNLADRW